MKKTKAKYGRLLGGAFILILMNLTLGGDYNLYNLWKYSKQKSMYKGKIKQNEQKLANLKIEIHKLKYDSTYVDYVARVKYKMVKKGESIYLNQVEDKVE